MLKISKIMVFLAYFWPKIGFYSGKLSPIIPKPLLIYSTVKNTSREVYSRSITYRAENAPKALYKQELFVPSTHFKFNNREHSSINKVKLS